VRPVLRPLQPIIAQIQAGGAKSLRAIAAELDARGIPGDRALAQVESNGSDGG
jgi:hypothetical protein